MAKPKFVFVVGTRPDAIKTAPVVLEFRKYADLVDTILISTGQHREMLAQALDAFGLTPEIDLDIMAHGQSLADVTRRILEGLDRAFTEIEPDMVFGQGDTSSTFVAGLASFYRQIPYGHIEAGLRTDTVWNPFPEEFNRRAVSLFAKLHFAPTSWSAENLRHEHVDSQTIFVTGNTGIDAVKTVADLHNKEWYPEHTGRLILLTTHRRENWGEPQREIARAARRILDDYPDTLLVVPMHRNPTVRQTLESELGDHLRADLIEPPEYMDFVKLLARCDLALTDSGGVQEEAPAFGKPVFVLRDTTERPEGVEAGTAMLVGTEQEVIVRAVKKVMDSPEEYARMAHATSPYGDGLAAARIRFVTLNSFGIESPEVPMWT